jgi:hypothetical protein
MSGPKVVRIVTREEATTICQRLIADVRREASALWRLAERLGVGPSNLKMEAEQRVLELERLLAGNQFLDVQKSSQANLAFLVGQRSQIEAEAVLKAEAARQASRRNAEAAQSLVKELQRRGLPVSADLQKFAGNPGPKAGLEKDAVQALIASALDQLRGSATEAAAIPEDRELAQRLSRGMDTVSLAEWQARRQATENPSASRLDRLIAEVQVLGDDAEAENFAKRAREIAFETSGGRRNLLTDSLMLDVTALIDARKRAAT